MRKQFIILLLFVISNLAFSQQGEYKRLGKGGKGTTAQAGDATWNYASFPDVEWDLPGGIFIPTALVPLTALLYASGMIQDEVEEQTLTASDGAAGDFFSSRLAIDERLKHVERVI